MARTKNTPAPKRRAILTSAAGVTAVAVIAGAVIVNGYDARELPEVSAAVWVTRGDGQYARVNTDLGELDTVRAVADPVGIVQSGPQSMIFSQGYSQAWPIDAAYPTDLTDSGTAGGATSTTAPAGTSFVTSEGDYVAYLTSLGDVYVGTFPEPGAEQTGAWKLDPFAGVETEDGEEPPHYAASAVAIAANGRVAVYSAAEKAVRIYNPDTASFETEPQAVPSAPDAEELTMSFAGDIWVLYSAEDGRLWAQGLTAPVTTGLGKDSVLQATASGDGEAYLADSRSLIKVGLADSTVTTLAEASGAPAAPIDAGGVTYAAWMSPSGVTLWASDAETSALEVPEGVLDEAQSIQPAFRSNGDRAVLTEASEGLVWTLPNGALVPVEDWEPLDESQTVEGTITVDDVVEQKPPVAVADEFGVRRGATVRLPLLYNDSDPNKSDGLSISAPSLTALSDESFGTVGLVDNNQTAVVRVAAESGSADFTYAASDGASQSAPAAVTLHVVPEDQETAPEWCDVEDCTQEWPTPQVVPGGFVEVPVLNGWVDAEGDPIALIDAVSQDPAAPLTIVPTADGSVAIRHQDLHAGDATFRIDVTVSDALGKTTTKTLDVRVMAAPALDAPPIVIAAGVNDPRQIDIGDFVTGGSGSYQLVDATPAQQGNGLSVTAVAASNVIEVSADASGDYMASYTVKDTLTAAQQTAVLRVSVAEVTSSITLPPLTAFVRPSEDSTLDILASAQNTTGRVLMVSSATTSDANLSASVVGNSYVRLSGTTADGLPGRVGVADVTVADGAGGSASTQVTVFMLAASHGIEPIAVPDAVTVRAGTQVDLSILENDISPRGERLLLHPDVIGSETEGELAFASGDVLRYLAPTEPGVYTLNYTTYLENDPARDDSAPITVTVLPPGSNRAPEPPVLTGRVLAGQAVTIPFDAAGVDPDGDAVTLVDVSQPEPGSGVASIAGSGAAIVYSAPADGVANGQVSFTYTVRDTSGHAGEAKVLIGVLNANASDVSPITYSDRVSAKVGSADPLTVTPLSNDFDPLNGTLALVDVRPLATPDTPEYARLTGLLDASALDEGLVAVRAGDIEGTHSYVYTAESSVSGSVAQGLIVVSAALESSPSQLTVADTSLTASTRHDLASGIDVVTGKVRWQAGDPSTLKLSLWGDAQEAFTSNGWKIAGEAPAEGAVIPFSLTGQDYSGNDVETFGFLRIPAFDDVRLQLRADATPTEVGEEASVELPIRKALDVRSEDVVEIRDVDSFAVQRDNAACAPSGADAATYSAGREAPWADTCSVQVRLKGQSAWSVVALPVAIIPKSPQAILNPVSQTISPGDTASITLIDSMVTWEGGRTGDNSSLALATSYGGSAFTVTTANGKVTAVANADAIPGTRETVTVTTPAYGGLSSSIGLVVGLAHPDSPKGATFTASCSVNSGSTCTVQVVGLPGEYDPFEGAENSGLSLKSVGAGGTATCPVATVTKSSATTVVASWPSGARPVGGECAVPFTVIDAQNRQGPGLLKLDVQGYPATPSSIATADYTGNSVTFDVTLGPAGDAHPAVSTVAIYRDGRKVASACAPAGPGNYRCVVGGLTAGQKSRFTARAVNSQGESGDTSAVESWAYEAPKITAATAESVYAPGTTSASNGAVEVSVATSDDTKEFEVVSTGERISRTGAVTRFTTTLHVGPTQLQLIPISIHQPPVTGENTGATATASVTVAGSPFYEGAVSAVAAAESITLTGGSLNANFSDKPASQIWFAWPQGHQTPSCTMGSDGAAQVSGNGNVRTSTTNTITGLNTYQEYRVAICGSNGYGAATSSVASSYTYSVPTPPTGSNTYSIATHPDRNGNVYTYGLADSPNLDKRSRMTIYYFYNGGNQSQNFDPGFDAGVQITARYCSDYNNKCGDPIDIDPAGSSPSAKVKVIFPSQCVSAPSDTDVSYEGAQPSDATIDVSSGTSYVLTWKNAPYTSLEGITHPVDLCPTTNPSPSPSPSP